MAKEIIEFINKIAMFKDKIDIDKLKKSIKSTSFEKLKKNEETDGFSEAIFQKKNKMIPFFNLGPKND